MKKILCMMVAMLFIATLSMAQQNRGRGMRATPEERAKRSVEMLNKQLTLTQTQKDSVYQFSLNEAKEQQALFQASKDGDRKEGFEKMRALREKTQQKIKGVLTEEQQKAYESLLQQRQKQMRERRGGGRNSQ